MSRVQTLALEILMMWEDIRDQRDRRTQFRLGILGQDVEQVKQVFADEIKQPEKVVDANEVADDEIDALLDRDLAGDGVEWITSTDEEVDPEEVTRLLRMLASGEASFEDMDSDGGWT